MKKLNNKKGKIHPTPPSATTNHSHLYLLPATIVTLAATLSQEDQEVLAYLVSCSGVNPQNTKPAAASRSGSGGDHPPKFNCNCFGCYMSYWVRWDSSPNRQQIHEIIDAYEDGLVVNDKKSGKNKKERRKKVSPVAEVMEKQRSEVEDPVGVSEYGGGGGDYGNDDRRRSDGDGEVGSVRKIVNFLGERVWGTVWGI